MAAADSSKGTQPLDRAGHGETVAPDPGLAARADAVPRAPSLRVARLGEELETPAGELARRPLVVVDADDSVAEVARAMRTAGTSAALVGEGAQGIVTDRDLRNRVVADELPATTPVRAVMSAPVVTLPADTVLHEVLLLMVDRDLHHVPLTGGGRVVGILTDKDLLREQAKGPLLLIERIKEAERLEALEGYADEIAATAQVLCAADVEPVRIARIIASLNDALTNRLLRLTEERLGPPPCPYAWMALGSEGRMEQVLVTDQDNALAYRDDTPEAAAYFEELAEGAVAGLLRAGFPRCPGGYMATNWRRPLAGWQELFHGWLERPEPQAVIAAEVFLDFRTVRGELSLEPLDALVLSGSERAMFLHQLARAALRFPPPLGRFGRIRADRGEVDLKRDGLAAIVLVGRLAAIAGRSRARATQQRLAAATQAGILSRGGVEALTDAFRFLMRLRLREQLRSLAAGGAPANTVRMDSLSPLEVHRLRDAFRAIGDAQRAIALRFQAEAP